MFGAPESPAFGPYRVLVTSSFEDVFVKVRGAGVGG